MIALCSCVTSAYGMQDETREEGYTRPGTNFVVKAPQENPSSRVETLLEERKEQLAPTATLETLDSFFCGKPCQVEGPVKEIFALYNSSLGDLTVTQKALTLLPPEHVLSVHVYQPVLTKEQEPAISVQHANLKEGTPIDYTGVLKYQTEESGFMFNVMFDLTGQKKPVLSVEKKTLVATPKDESVVKESFVKEVEALGEGIKHVAIFAPKDTSIPILQEGEKKTVQAIRLKVPLSKVNQ